MRSFFATGYTLQFLAVAFSGSLIIVSAPVIAAWSGIRDHLWASLLLAGLVAIRGMEHLDVRRLERHLRYGPSASVEFVPQVLMVLAA